MRRAIALMAVLAPAAALAFSVPPPPRRFLHDGASALSSHDRTRIEDRLMQLNQAGQQISVAVLPSLDGEDVRDASIRIAEAWGPGGREADNGALITVFMRDRKMAIEVGYGLEERIPDSVARQIVMDRMRPAFRANRYADGIMAAIDAVASASMGQRLPPPSAGAVPLPVFRMQRDTAIQGCNAGGFGCICFALVAFAMIRGIFRTRRPRFYGFGQQVVQRPRMPWWGWLLFGNAMGSSHRRSSWGSSSGWSGGWSGGSSRSSSSWGGGRSSGGSFGGGSFGGGGASGSW